MYLLLKSVLLPPGIFIILLVLALWCFHSRNRRLGHGLVWLALSFMYLLATPIVSFSLHTFVQPANSLDDKQLVDSEAIVVLGAARHYNAPEYGGRDTVGNALLARLRYGAHLHRSSKLPILVTGGPGYEKRRPEAEIMAEVLKQDFDVNARWQERESLTTWENALFSREILAAEGINKIVLVSQAYHIPRATKVFEKAGFDVLPAPTGFIRRPESGSTWLQWLPDSQSFLRSALAYHELLGQLFYRLRAFARDLYAKYQN